MMWVAFQESCRVMVISIAGSVGGGGGGVRMASLSCTERVPVGLCFQVLLFGRHTRCGRCFRARVRVRCALGLISSRSYLLLVTRFGATFETIAQLMTAWHMVETQTLFLWYMPADTTETVAENSATISQLACSSYIPYVQLLEISTQDSNLDGRIQNHKRWPVHHCRLLRICFSENFRHCFLYYGRNFNTTA